MKWWSIWRFHYYMVVSVVLQPCDPQVRVDRVDGGDEEEEQAQERLHATEVEWRMITISDYTAAFVYLNVCICASSLKLFLKVSTWFPMTEKQHISERGRGLNLFLSKNRFLSDPSPIIGYACHSLTDWLLFSKLDACDPGVWRCQLKTCWGC